MSTIKNLQESQDAIFIHFDNPTWVAFESLTGWDENDRQMPEDSEQLISAWNLDTLHGQVDGPGLVYGPIVTPTESGQFQIVAGFRRIAMMYHVMGMGYIPLVVRELTATEIQHVRAAENSGRIDLTYMELSHALHKRIAKSKKGMSMAPEAVFAAFGLKADKGKSIMALNSLLPEFQHILVDKFDREASKDTIQFTLEHANTLLGSPSHTKAGQKLVLECWYICESKKMQPGIVKHWREIVKDPQAWIDAQMGANDTTKANGPDAITGAVVDTDSVLPLITPAKGKMIDALDASIIHYAQQHADLMTSVDGEKLAEMTELFGDTLQMALEAQRAAAYAEAYANLLNYAVSKKWLSMTGTQKLPTNGSGATAGDNHMFELIDGEES